MRVRMQRYFNDKIENNVATLNKEDSYHIKKVMRMKLGEKIEIVSNKVCYIAEITSLDTDNVQAKIMEKQEENPEINIKVSLVQSLVKEQKMDFIIQKATELGISEIIPYEATRSIIKRNGKEDKKIDRWQKIVKEASEQSKRVTIPKVMPILSLDELIRLDNYDVKILCTVRENSKNIKNILSNVKTNDTMLIVVGPEGGFTEQEEEKMIENGFITVSLGNTVLRTETVALFLMSVIRYHDMR